jgi:formylglycine-generating enzyme required for sulfatase activity
VEVEGPLLRKTGDTPECVSRWGDDGAYDMAGNLDEWIDDPGGTFVGGFFSRATKNGCLARVDNHSPEYFDYSIGTRCCDDIKR